jgi:hypothetical protein
MISERGFSDAPRGLSMLLGTILLLNIVSCAKIFIHEPTSFAPLTDNVKADFQTSKNWAKRFISQAEKELSVEGRGLTITAQTSLGVSALEVPIAFRISNATGTPVRIAGDACRLTPTRVRKLKELPSATLASAQLDGTSDAWIIPANDTRTLELTFQIQYKPWIEEFGPEGPMFMMLLKRSDVELWLESDDGEKFGFLFEFRST